jgi:hypothetical protein
MIENPDFTQDEELLLKLLFPLSGSVVNSTSRNPEKIEGIVKAGRTSIRQYAELLKNNRKEIAVFDPSKREKFLAYINDRFLLLRRAGGLPLYSKKTRLNLSLGKLPRIEDVASDAHLMELAFGNLYMSASIFNSLNKRTRTSNEIMTSLVQTFENYEITRSADGRKGTYINDAPGRAQLAFAYETLASRPNVFELVKTTNDYSVLYGRDGIQYEVKGQILFPEKETFKSVHRKTIRTYGRICFPEPLRALLLELIPTEYKTTTSAAYG